MAYKNCLRMKKTCFDIKLLFLLLFCAFGVLNANAQPLSVTLYNADNGLPQSTVTCLYQDSYGFIWLGTQEGLARFDGYNFQSYKHLPSDQQSIGDGYVYSIAEDARGNIWVGTRSGLSRQDRASGKFDNYHFRIEGRMSKGVESVYGLLFDDSGQLWFNTANALHRYDAVTDSLTSFRFGNGWHSDYSTLRFDMSPLVDDGQGNLWIGTSHGVLVFDRAAHTFTALPIDLPSSGKASMRITAIWQAPWGQMWLGGESGLYTYNAQSGRCELFRPKNRGVSMVEVTSIAEGHEGYIMVGTQNEVWAIKPDGTAHPIRDVQSGGYQMKLNEVMTFLYDRSRVLWIGTQIGLMKWSRLQQRFAGVSKDARGNNKFGGNVVFSLLQEDNGITWVGTWGSGLYRYDPKTDNAELFSLNEQGARHICSDHVYSIFRRRNGEMLIGTVDGAMRYNRALHRFENLGNKQLESLLDDNRIYCIREDSAQRLYFGTINGLHRLSPNGEILSIYADGSDGKSLINNKVYDVLIAKEGDIWVSAPNGITRLSGEMEPIGFYLGESERGHRFMGEMLCLFQDSRGSIWAGSTVGLFRYAASSNTFVRMIESQLVYSIEEDNEGRLWMSSNNGLIRFVPEANMLRRFSVGDGLNSNEFNLNASWHSPNGDILFGNIAGYNYFNPDSVLINYVRPRTGITSIEVIDRTGKLIRFAPGTSSITITKGFKSLNIEFSSFDYNFPERNEYRYKLEGFENDWVELDTRHSVHYTNLPERTYRMVLQSSNCDRIWSEGAIALTIVVKSPLWSSYMAFAIYALLIVGVALAYVISRRKMISKLDNLLMERGEAMDSLQRKTEELTLVNRNITDSIEYAKRIQRAIMPSLNAFKSILPESFVLYMPKDIVSGDFYWISQARNRIFVATVDCTGHGVPGAFMSIIGMELLRNIINTEEMNDAADVLNRLSYSIYNTFSATSNEGGVQVKDSMDVAFCVIDREYNILQYAGAYSNLYLVRDDKILEFNGDRYAVGSRLGNGLDAQFSSYYIPLQNNDMIYMLSDGYADQFGGPEGKKFKTRRLRHLLLNIHNQPINSQRQQLYEAITDWRGDLEQVDDILVVGIRPDLSCLF